MIWRSKADATTDDHNGSIQSTFDKASRGRENHGGRNQFQFEQFRGVAEASRVGIAGAPWSTGPNKWGGKFDGHTTTLGST